MKTIWLLTGTFCASCFVACCAAADYQTPPSGSGSFDDPFRLNSLDAAYAHVSAHGQVVGATYKARPRGPLLLHLVAKRDRVSEWFFDLGLGKRHHHAYIRAAAARGDEAARIAEATTVLRTQRVVSMVAVLESLQRSNLFAALALGDHYRADGNQPLAESAYQLAANLDYGEAYHRLAMLTGDDRYLERGAELNHPRSIYQLAQQYRDHGNPEGAANLIERLRSLNQEDARLYAAQWVLLSRTEPGRAGALSEIRRLASQGHYDAIAMMGDVYALGRDVPQDFNETAIWWRRAADPQAPDHVLRAMAEMFLQYRAKPIYNPRLAAKIMDRLMTTRRSVRDNSAYLELWSRAHQKAGHQRRAADIRWQAFAADLGIPI